ncbi:MAG: hypothetical protein GY835_21235 [bacterium]|nr:hypothetical protein [bacterium]
MRPGSIIFLAATLLFLILAQVSDADNHVRLNSTGKPLESWLMGSEAVLVDYYWFDLTQYYGAYSMGQNDLSDFLRRSDRLFNLDVEFHRATIFSSAVIASDLDDPRGALEILRNAENRNPDYWVYPYEQGFLHYLWLNDYPEAIAAFSRAGKLEDCTPGWRHFLARINELGGDPRVAWEMWADIASTAEHGRLQESAHRNMVRLEKIIRESEGAGAAQGH